MKPVQLNMSGAIASRGAINNAMMPVCKELLGPDVRAYVRDENVSRNLASDYLIDSWPEIIIDNTVPAGEIEIRQGSEVLARMTMVGRMP